MHVFIFIHFWFNAIFAEIFIFSHIHYIYFLCSQVLFLADIYCTFYNIHIRLYIYTHTYIQMYMRLRKITEVDTSLCQQKETLLEVISISLYAKILFSSEIPLFWCFTNAQYIMYGGAKAVAHTHPHTSRCTIFSCRYRFLCMYVCMYALVCTRLCGGKSTYVWLQAKQQQEKGKTAMTHVTHWSCSPLAGAYTHMYMCSPRCGALSLCEADEMNHALCSPTLVPLFNFNESA